MVGLLGAGEAATVSSSLISGLSTAGADMLATVSGVLPVVIPVVAAIVLIRLGFKVFKMAK